MMIDAGAEVNSHFAGTTPLIRAIQRCHLKVVEVLIRAGADANLKDEELKSPLIQARGKIQIESIPRRTGNIDKNVTGCRGARMTGINCSAASG